MKLKETIIKALSLGTGLAIGMLLIARLSKEKGILRAIEALAQSKRTDMRFYMIGDGPQKEEIARLIRNYQMDSCITLLGEQRDPYPYLSRADWLLVPSFHEAAPMVFDEAMLMGINVITTDTTSAEEMIGSTHGIVCENSTEGITDVLTRVGKPESAKKGHFDNEKQRKQFAALLRG